MTKAWNSSRASTAPGGAALHHRSSRESQEGYLDDDGDGYGAESSAISTCDVLSGYIRDGGDCDDADPTIHPGTEEFCDDVDSDCDGVTDEDDSTDALTWYADVDEDTYGDPSSTRTSCTEPAGWVADSTDCDDDDAWRSPGTSEVCDDVDNDCDGVVDEDCDVTCDLRVPTDFPNIQDAMNAAVDGETICVQPGTWASSLTFPGTAITVFGIAGPEATILRYTIGGPVVYFHLAETESTVLEGFTITGGLTNYGGGIQVWGASPTLRNLVVTGNAASGFGGGIYVTEGAPLLEDITVSGNTSGYAGGGLALVSAPAVLTRVEVMDNVADLNGGGMYLKESEAVLEDLTVTGNSANQYGGGLFMDDSPATLTRLTVSGNTCNSAGGLYLRASDALISDSVFEDNVVAHYGGGVICDVATPLFQNVRFIGNTADDCGAGLQVFFSCTASFRNCSFTGNVADGAAVYIESGSAPTFENVVILGNTGGALSVEGDSTPSFTNVTIAGNVAEWNAGVMLQHDAAPTFVNVDVSFNTASEAGGGYSSDTGLGLPCTSSNLYGNLPENVLRVPDPTGTDGNISVDPTWLDATSSLATEWNIHLGTASSLVDAGSATLLDPDGSPSDIGAWGGPGAASWDLDADGYPAAWSPGAYQGTAPGDKDWGFDCDDLDPAVYPGSGC